MIATVTVDESKVQNILKTSPDLVSGRIEGVVHVATPPNSVALDFNTILKEVRGQSEYIALVHDDVWLPEGWADEVMDQIAMVEARDYEWGVLGVAGAKWDKELGQKIYEGNLKDRMYAKFPGESALPCLVDTLDEVCLIVRNDGKTRLNNHYTGHDLYGAELCLRLNRVGCWSYAIDAYLNHRGSNTKDDIANTFYFNGGLLWMEYGDQMQPIATTCCTLRRLESGLVVMER